MTFKYNGRIYNPVNLEKKLKKLGITENDIEILPNQEKKTEDNSKEFKTLRLKSSIDTLTYITYWSLNTPVPTVEDLVKERGWEWNEELKIGLKGFTKNYIDTLYYEE